MSDVTAAFEQDVLRDEDSGDRALPGAVLFVVAMSCGLWAGIAALVAFVA
jgi:hypothetical protein